MSVSIPENPFSKLASQLKEKENSLNEREQALISRERSLSSTDKIQNRIIYATGIGLVILLILIVVNFFLDHKRRRDGRI